MVQVDLITGFLGAGKTTFLRRYAAWWAGQGVKVCVLENDFGAVNVDAMLLQDLEARGVELETISGGCDCDTHQRRMRTKLIAMAMRGFDRVLGQEGQAVTAGDAHGIGRKQFVRIRFSRNAHPMDAVLHHQRLNDARS